MLCHYEMLSHILGFDVLREGGGGSGNEDAELAAGNNKDKFEGNKI